MSFALTKCLRRLGLGSFTGIVLYLLTAITALALTVGYTSLFTLGTGDWAWFTLGNDSAWFVLGQPTNWEAIAPTYTVARIVLAIFIGLVIVTWETVYIFGNEEVNWVLAFSVAMLGSLVIIISQVIWNVL